MALAIADCLADQFPALQAFMARVYGPRYILLACEPLFRWQFGGGSDAEPDGFHVKLAILNGEIVGCLGYIPVETMFAGHVMHGAWLANWIVDPDHRRLGLGPLLMREVTNQFDVAMNLGPNQDARAVLVKMRWEDVGVLTRYVCVLDEPGALLLTGAGRLDWPVPQTRPVCRDAVYVRPITVFDKDATSVWDRLTSTLGGGTRRSADYLNWRYARHPVWTYRCFEARQRGDLVGFAVSHIEAVRDMPVKVARLVELVAMSPAADELVRAVVEDARSQDAVLIDFFCSSPLVGAALEAHGFLSGPESLVAQVPMLFQPLDPRRTAIHFMAHLAKAPAGMALEQWYVTKSDGDQDRPN
jgi:hypothetical protein